MRRVLLTDCAPQTLEELVPMLESRYDVRTCCSGQDVLEEYLTFRPELVVLDLMLPGCDTVGLLRAIRAQSAETKVLATSCGVNDSITEILEQTQVPFLMVKPIENRVVAARLGDLERLLDRTGAHSLPERADSILQELGLERNRVGFACLREAALYLYDHPDCLFTDELYPYVAKVCNGTAQSVERAMKRCVESGWRRRRKPVWNYYISDTAQCPPNHQFLNALTAALRKIMDRQ